MLNVIVISILVSFLSDTVILFEGLAVFCLAIQERIVQTESKCETPLLRSMINDNHNILHKL